MQFRLSNTSGVDRLNAPYSVPYPNHLTGLLSNQHIASTVSTGGVGYGFEHRVQAYYLLRLIEGEPTSRRLGPIVRLQFQGRYELINTDDLICTHVADGRTSRVFMQCRMTMHAREKDPGFSSALRNAWADFSAALVDSEHPFNIDTDRLALVYDTDCNSDGMQTVRRLIQLAKNSNDASDFSRKCHTDKHRKMLVVMHNIVQPDCSGSDPAQALWAFLRLLAVDQFGLGGEGTIDLDSVMSTISKLTGDPSSTYLIWSNLVETAASLNGNGATVDASNLEKLINPEVLWALRKRGRRHGVELLIPTFPWGVTLWAVQAVKTYGVLAERWTELTANELLLLLRALRAANWLACELASTLQFDVIAREIAYSLATLQGSYDDKAALATFVMLNLADMHAQSELVQWAAQCTARHHCLNTCRVELTLRRLYFHYHGKDVPGSCWLEDKVALQRGRGISRARDVFGDIWPSFVFDRVFGPETPQPSDPPIDQFIRMTWAIGDTCPDYRRPKGDSSAWPTTEGVASFQALMKAVRSGCIGDVLSRYRLCTSEPTFERLLNAFAELSAHVRNRVKYISANDAYILGEMKKLLLNSVAGEPRSYAVNKLTVLPIQGHLPLCNCEVINLTFENISLAPAFEDAARHEHMALADAYTDRQEYTDPRSLWSFETIYADVILAMALRTKIFANSEAESRIANIHGIGVSELRMQAVFYE